MSESRVLQQAEEASAALAHAHDQLRSDSLVIRHKLEAITIPLLAWVYDAYKLFVKYDDSSNRVWREMALRLLEIEGLVVGRHDVQIAYNVETAMDERTENALAPAKDALYALLETIEADPLAVADEDSSTAPMVGLLRQMAEGLGAR